MPAELLNKAKLRRQLVELRSDIDAIVQSVAKVSVGSVMQSGAAVHHSGAGQRPAGDRGQYFRP